MSSKRSAPRNDTRCARCCGHTIRRGAVAVHRNVIGEWEHDECPRATVTISEVAEFLGTLPEARENARKAVA